MRIGTKIILVVVYVAPASLLWGSFVLGNAWIAGLMLALGIMLTAIGEGWP